MFIANTSASGAAIDCWWSGPGDANGVNAKLTYHRAAGAKVQRFTKDILRNIFLCGQLPPGFEPTDFANPDEIAQRSSSAGTTGQQLSSLNESVARVGQTVGDVQEGLRRAGDAGRIG